MNLKQLIEKLNEATAGANYSGSLTGYVAESIVSGRSNFTVTNLLTYCSDMNLIVIIVDETTDERYVADSVMTIHNILTLLMERYDVDAQLIYRKTAIHYTLPKLIEPGNKSKSKQKGERKYSASLSIKTLLAVCGVIHADILFLPKIDESSDAEITYL